jgi:hypothetical protein
VKKITPALIGAVALVLTMTACGPSQEYTDREDQQDAITLDDSLEIHNLEEKLERQNDPNAIRYVYLMNFGQIVGYYVIQGKVSSNGSQLAPEQDIVQPYAGGDRYVVDSSQDDGTYGAGDPGIFFFTSEGVLVETSLDYIVSDSPIDIDVPRLSE